MDIKINGKSHSYDTSELSIYDVIKENNIESPDMVSVQVNGEFIDRDKFSALVLKHDDEVDFLYFMGGGN